jgi:aspartate 1-decarboxylase
MASRCFLHAKIHRATITEANVDYEGSLAVCPRLLEASGIFPNERVEIYNVDNGERLATYVIVGREGEICLNGAAALKGEPGQRVIVAAYAWLEERVWKEHSPRLVFVNESNGIVEVKP